MAKLSRRKFLSGVFTAGAALYVGGWWFFKVRKGDATYYIKSVLKKRLGYLNLEKISLDRFARVYQERLDTARLYWGSWIGILGPVYAMFDMVRFLPKSRSFKNFEDDIITMYLLSSDFFIYDADTNRTVNFIEYYDSPEVGCANPFAEF